MHDEPSPVAFSPAHFRPWQRGLITFVACAATTLLATPLLGYLDLANIVMLFLLTVLLVAVIVGLGMACELALQKMEIENTEVKRLRDKLEQGILGQITHCFPTGDVSNRLPNTSNIAFEYIEGEAILLLLNKLGIAASSGSACTSGSLEPSHVMRAMGIPYTAAHGTIRFSLSVYNTEAEVDRVIAAVPPIIAQLRKLSPYWSDKGPAANPEAAFAPTYA